MQGPARVRGRRVPARPRALRSAARAALCSTTQRRRRAISRSSHLSTSHQRPHLPPDVHIPTLCARYAPITLPTTTQTLSHSTHTHLINAPIMTTVHREDRKSHAVVHRSARIDITWAQMFQNISQVGVTFSNERSKHPVGCKSSTSAARVRSKSASAAKVRPCRLDVDFIVAFSITLPLLRSSLGNHCNQQDRR